MGFKWPEIVRQLDCAPIGYPGVVVELVLNPPPLPEGAFYSGETWHTVWYERHAQIFKRVVAPGQYRDDGAEQIIELGTAERLWQLDNDPDFDNRILLWAMSEYARIRYQALPEELKNWPTASSKPVTS